MDKAIHDHGKNNHHSVDRLCRDLCSVSVIYPLDSQLSLFASLKHFSAYEIVIKKIAENGFTVFNICSSNKRSIGDVRLGLYQRVDSEKSLPNGLEMIYWVC